MDPFIFSCLSDLNSENWVVNMYLSKLGLDICMQIFTSLDIDNRFIFYFVSSQEGREISHTQAHNFTSPVVKKCKEVNHFYLEAMIFFLNICWKL
jgi:hypothetical protein